MAKTSTKRVLAIAAHPDDLEFTSTIMLRRLISEGYDVYFLIITNGENGFKLKGYNKAQRIKARKKEQLKAAEMIGVKKVIFWNYRDGFLEYDEDLRKDLVTLIRKIKPEIIFSFDPGNKTFSNLNLFHRDHRVAAESVFDACFAAKNSFIYSKQGKPHRISKLFLYGSDKPNFFIDITEDMQYKIDVLGCYKSQLPNFDEFMEYFKENLAKYSPDYEYSEGFRVLDIIQIN